MKTKKTRSTLKGNQYVQKMGNRLVASLLLIVALMCVVGLIMDADTMTCIGTGSCSLASMMLIGNVGDVSDRDTHGSNIAYQVYLIDVSQIDTSIQFPLPNASREIGQIPMLTGQFMKYFEAHDIPTYLGNGEKGDITTSGENNFTLIMGGMRDQLLNYIESHAGGKFVILFKEIESTQWNIIGSADRPMIFSSFEAKNDKDGRYVTFTFKRTSITQYYKYVGTIITAPPTTHTAGATTLAIASSSNELTIPNGVEATYAINAISGLTANDKGRIIVLKGSGTDKPATIADCSSIVLEDGSTWIAKAGSQLSLRVLDANTLIEIQGTRVQTA